MNSIPLSQLIYVFSFGILGVGSRFAIDLFVIHRWPLRQESWGAPQSTALATLLINMMGCLLAAFVFQLSNGKEIISQDLKLGILVGFCGGFTTFSGFGLQVIQLWNAQNVYAVVAYIVLTPVLCLLATGSGVILAKLFQ